MATQLVVPIGDVLSALATALRADTSTAAMNISVMQRVNADPDLALPGWIGIYAQDVHYEPRAIGAGAHAWWFRPKFHLVVQASNMDSSEDAFRTLSDFIGRVLNVVLVNAALAGYVDDLQTMDIEYAYDRADGQSLHFVGSLITLAYEGRTN